MERWSTWSNYKSWTRGFIFTTSKFILQIWKFLWSSHLLITELMLVVGCNWVWSKLSLSDSVCRNLYTTISSGIIAQVYFIRPLEILFSTAQRPYMFQVLQPTYVLLNKGFPIQIITSFDYWQYGRVCILHFCLNIIIFTNNFGWHRLCIVTYRKFLLLWSFLSLKILLCGHLHEGFWKNPHELPNTLADLSTKYYWENFSTKLNARVLDK